LHSGAVYWSPVLQAGSSWVRSPMVSLEIFIDIILPAALWPRGWHSLLTEMSTSNIFWRVKAASALDLQPYHPHVPIVLKSEASTSWNSQGLSRPVQGLLIIIIIWIGNLFKTKFSKCLVSVVFLQRHPRTVEKCLMSECRFMCMSNS
jgi:hypothetical protein